MGRKTMDPCAVYLSDELVRGLLHVRNAHDQLGTLLVREHIPHTIAREDDPRARRHIRDTHQLGHMDQRASAVGVA